MRTLTLLALLFTIPACTGTPEQPPTPPPPSSSVADEAVERLSKAVAAWEAAPSDDTLAGVSKAALPASEIPVGDLAQDRIIAHALTHVLLRPDLGIPRLEPHAATLQGEDATSWLEALLRGGDLARFAAEVNRLYGKTIDPEQPALKVAAQHAVRHREVGVAEALYAHDAGTVAEKQVTYGRRALRLPMPDLAQAMASLGHLLPEWRLKLVLTRATLPADPELLDTPGALPASRESRRIVAYATSDTEGAIDAIARAFHEDPPLRTAGYVVEATSPEGRTLVLCSEGKFTDGTYWLVSACEPERASTWLAATDAYADLLGGGMSPTEAGKTIRTTWGPRVQAAPAPP